MSAGTERILVIAAEAGRAEAQAAFAGWDVAAAGHDPGSIAAAIESAGPDVVVAVRTGPEPVVVAAWTGVPVVWVTTADATAPGLALSGTDAGSSMAFIAARLAAAVVSDVAAAAGHARRIVSAPGRGRAGSVPPGASTHAVLGGMLAVWRAVFEGDAGAELAWTRDFARRLARREGDVAEAAAPSPRPPRERPRLAVVVHELSVTGSPIHTLRVMQELAKRPLPWETTVFGLEDGPLREDFRALGLATEIVTGAGSAGESGSLLDRLEQFDPDVVLFNGSPLFREVVMTEAAGFRTLWWIHAGIVYATQEGGMIEDTAVGRMVRHALGVPREVLFSTHHTQEQFTLLRPDLDRRSSWIPYGLDLGALDRELAGVEPDRAALRRSLGIPEDSILILGIGGLQERKNQRALVRAFQQALDGVSPEARRRARLVFIGPLTCAADPERAYLAALRADIASEHASHVEVRGLQPSIWPWLVAADCHALVSTNESSPLANFEAMACAKPCLSARVHGIPEVVRDGENGFLVDPRDDADIRRAVAAVLELGAARPAELARLGASARAFVERHHDVAITARMAAERIATVLAAEPRERSAMPRGPVTRRHLETLLTMRWAMVKGDGAAARHLVQAYCHRLWDPAPPPPEVAVSALTAARTAGPLERAAADLAAAALPWRVTCSRHDPPAGSPRPWTGTLASIAASDPRVVVVFGAELAEAVIVLRWIGLPVVWVPEDGAAPEPDADPEILRPPGTRLLLHARALACRVVEPSLAAIVAAVEDAEHREPPPDRAPYAPSTWAHLHEQLELLRAVFAKGHGTEAELVMRHALRWLGPAETAPGPARARPRVLFVTHQYSRTGAPVEMLLLLTRFRETDTGFDFVVTGFEDGPLRDQIARETGVPARLVARAEPPWPFDAFLAEVDALDPDLIVLNASVFYQESAILKLKGRRVIWWIHDGINAGTRAGHLFSDPALASMTLHGVTYPDRLFFPARDTLEQFAACCPSIRERAVHVRNGVDAEGLDRARVELRGRRAGLRAELGLGAHDFVFLCVGSFERRKNHRMLVEAFQDFLDEAPDERGSCHLLLLGDTEPHRSGPEAGLAAEIRAAIRPPHRDRIRLLGARPSALPCLALADAHVLVSTNESSPLANLEALALEVPCLSSTVDGIPEVVADGERGFLVSPHDRAAIRDALARVWRVVRAGGPELASLQARGRAFVLAEHDVRRTGALLLAELRKVLAEIAAPAIPALRTHEADRYVQRQLIQRWAVFKKDVGVECHIVRSHCHRFFEPPHPGG